MKLAYLTARYPKVSHTFIRREILELERRGHSVLRVAIRPVANDVVDPVDRSEQERTVVCLARPWTQLAQAVLRTAVERPLRLAHTVQLALRLALRSERGLVRHAAYVVEACFLARLLRAAQVEHLHVHFGTNPATVALLIHELCALPYSLTVHGPAEFDAPEGFALASKLARARFCVAISSYAAAQLCRWISHREWHRVHVVHCAVDDRFLERPEPIDPASRMLLFVGRLAAQKGLFVLLDAVRQLVSEGEDLQLVLAGDGELRAELEQRIAELELGEQVAITGWVDEEQVRKHLRDARALVLPSFAEGLPVVLMEALAMGRPVISTWVAGIPELVRPGENGWLVPAGDARELAAALRAALRAPVHALDAMGASGHARVREQHYLPTEVAKLEALLLAARSPAP